MQRNLNRQLKQEPFFPLVLHYNYNQVIRPRGDLLKQKLNYFELHEAFQLTDKQFCRKWNVPVEKLRALKKRRARANDEEKDYLWAYIRKF